MSEDIEGQKSNLACLTLLKAKKLNINIRTEGILWTILEYRTKVKKLIDAQLQKKVEPE